MSQHPAPCAQPEPSHSSQSDTASVPPAELAPGLLAGRTLVVTGVVRPASIATAIAELAHRQGARVILTARPATIAATRSVARGLKLPDEVLPLDVTDPAQLAQLESRLRALRVERVDGLVHAIAFAHRRLLGQLLPTPGPRQTKDAEPAVRAADAVNATEANAAEANAAGASAAAQRSADLQTAFSTSAASLAELTHAVLPLLTPGASILALSFETTRAHPGYGWMGPLKAALEASVRYLAVELGAQGVRVNSLSCGPLFTPAASAIPDLAEMAAAWDKAAPLGWDPSNAQAVARTGVALLSDWLPATTGQVIRADGGATLR